MSNKTLFIGLVVVAVIAIIAEFTPAGRQVAGRLGGVTNYDTLQASGLIVGTNTTNSSNVSFMKTGTCTLYQYVNTIAATSSITTDCVDPTTSGAGTGGGHVALSGIQKGDTVFATLSTSTSALVATAGGLVLTGASASTTSGYITVTLTNLKGTTFTFPSGASSTVSYLVLRTQTTNQGL